MASQISAASVRSTRLSSRNESAGAPLLPKRPQEKARIRASIATVALAAWSAIMGEVGGGFTPARAQQPDDSIAFCARYARAAVNQFIAAHAVETCRHIIDEIPARWHLDYGKHYDACMSIVASHNRGFYEQEHKARADALNECINEPPAPNKAPVQTASSSPSASTVEFRTDRQGNDYRIFNVPPESFGACRSACEADERCQAWSYESSNAQRSNGVCWLKSPAPPAVAKQITTSGVIVARLGQALINPPTQEPVEPGSRPPVGLSGSVPQPSASAQFGSSPAPKTIVIWRLGSPHDGKTPDTNVDPRFSSLVHKSGYELTVTALPAMEFLNRFRDAVANHQEPDIVAIDNYGLLNGISTAIGKFDGLFNEPGMKQRMIFASRSLRGLEGSRGGWELLVSGSPNAEAARALTFLDPECDEGWTSGTGPGELNQMAPEIASAYLTDDQNKLSSLSDLERLDHHSTFHKPLQVTGITQCSYWGNDRLRFGVVVLRFETPTMVGNTPVLIVLRKSNEQWRLLAATEDRLTLDQLPAQLRGLPFGTAVSTSGQPVPAQLLSPDAGQSPQPVGGDRFGDYVWQPSVSPNIAVEVVEFSTPFWSRLFLRKHYGPRLAKDSISAGQLFGGQRPEWRIWSITNSGDIALSERR